MAKPAISAPFDGNYEPHNYLNGVIVALILYIVAKEPTVNRTKLECYIILLNRMIKNATGSELFKWTLNGRRCIGNFCKFFEYMEGIRPKGRSKFVIRNSSNVRSILPQLGMILRNLLPYLSELLTKYENSTAGAMLNEIQKQDNGTNSYR